MLNWCWALITRRLWMYRCYEALLNNALTYLKDMIERGAGVVAQHDTALTSMTKTVGSTPGREERRMARRKNKGEKKNSNINVFKNIGLHVRWLICNTCKSHLKKAAFKMKTIEHYYIAHQATPLSVREQDQWGLLLRRTSLCKMLPNTYPQQKRKKEHRTLTSGTKRAIRSYHCVTYKNSRHPAQLHSTLVTGKQTAAVIIQPLANDHTQQRQNWDEIPCSLTS